VIYRTPFAPREGIPHTLRCAVMRADGVSSFKLLIFLRYYLILGESMKGFASGFGRFK
jgi:hypothetical protein